MEPTSKQKRTPDTASHHAHAGQGEDTAELSLPAPSLVFRNGSECFEVTLDELPSGAHYVFGRFKKSETGVNDAVLISLPTFAPRGWNSRTVSKVHFELWRDPKSGSYMIRDRGSRNGTWARVSRGPLSRGEKPLRTCLEPNEGYNLPNGGTFNLPQFATVTFHEGPQKHVAQEVLSDGAPRLVTDEEGSLGVATYHE